MRVVITGASGNVGTSLLTALAAEPTVREIVGVARRVPAIGFEKTTWRRADVTESDLPALFAGADVVVHLAWLIQPSRDERVTHRVNVEGSARVLDAVARAQVPALVYASSIGAYAPGPKEGTIDESWPTTGVPTSFYSRHKAATEALLDRFESEHPDVRVVRLRPALIFKRSAATEIRRLFIGPFLPGAIVRPGMLPLVPLPRGLRTQAVHSLDVGEAYRLAIVRNVRGAFNLAAEPILDGPTLAEALGTRLVTVPPWIVRAAMATAWHARLAPAEPSLFDLVLQLPELDVTRARAELAWTPATSSIDAVHAFLRGMAAGMGAATAPLAPDSWRSRVDELRSGVGGRVA